MTLVCEKGFIGNLPPGVHGIKTAYFETDWNANFSNVRARSILTAGNHRFPFTVPPDFLIFVEAYIEKLPAASFTDEDINLASDYAEFNEPFQTYAETDNVSVFSGVGGEWSKLDISTVLTNIAAGHRGGVSVTHVVIGTTVYYGRLVLRYL